MNDKTGLGQGELVLVLGGARSGKSSFAQALAQAQEQGLPVAYIATAIPVDGEMEKRIVKHRETRPPGWKTVEAPYSADREAAVLCQEPGFVVWDCLTVFLSNILYQSSLAGAEPEAAEAEIIFRLETMLSSLEGCPGTLVVVANEVGMGIVPEYPLGRNFRDLAGRVNQFLARKADKVYFVIAGLPVRLK